MRVIVAFFKYFLTENHILLELSDGLIDKDFYIRRLFENTDDLVIFRIHRFLENFNYMGFEIIQNPFFRVKNISHTVKVAQRAKHFVALSDILWHLMVFFVKLISFFEKIENKF